MQIKNYTQTVKQAAGYLLKSIAGLSTPFVPNSSYVFASLAFIWGLKNKTAQLQAYKNIVVYSIVNVLVRKTVEPPLLVYKVIKESENRKLKRFNFKSDNNALGKYNILQAKALQEVESHDLITLLENPNKYQTGRELKEHFWFNYSLSGDGYIWAETLSDGPRSGKVMALHSLQADKVTIVKNQNDFSNPVEYYLFSDWNGAQHRIESSNMMHLSKWSFEEPSLGGFSPLIPGSKTIARNDANQLMQGQTFNNGGTGTIISSDIGENKTTGDPYHKLTTQQIDDMKDTIKRDWSGSMNSGKIHVTNGYVNVQKLGDTLVDLAAIQAENSDWRNIGAIYGVNPILVGDMSGGTENNVKEAYKALVTNVVVFELRKFDEKFNYFIKPFFKTENLEVKHDLTEFAELAPDLKLMMEVYGKSWQVTPNEYREVINLEKSKDPNMDKIYITSGMMPLEDMNTTDFNDISDPNKQYDYN